MRRPAGSRLLAHVTASVTVGVANQPPRRLADMGPDSSDPQIQRVSALAANTKPQMGGSLQSNQPIDITP